MNTSPAAEVQLRYYCKLRAEQVDADSLLDEIQATNLIQTRV